MKLAKQNLKGDDTFSRLFSMNQKKQKNGIRTTCHLIFFISGKASGPLFNLQKVLVESHEN